MKILDFGLARQQEDAAAASAASDTRSPTLARPTDAGTVLGTVGYMSPEQVRGHAADARSDIFSLGCVVHEMLTGRRAFQRETAAETMTATCARTLVRCPSVPARARPGRRAVPREAPAERFQSAGDLAFALASLAGTRRRDVGPAPGDRRRALARRWGRLAALSRGPSHSCSSASSPADSAARRRPRPLSSSSA